MHHQSTSTNEHEELEKVNQELYDRYSKNLYSEKTHVSELNEAEWTHLKNFFSNDARLHFLLSRRDLLSAKQKAFAEQMQDLHQGHAATTSGFVAFFDQAKKFIDLIDDAWSAARAQVPAPIAELLGPFLVGIPGAILHFFEGVQSLKRVLQAYREEGSPQRKTRIATGVVGAMCAGAGVGMAATLIAAGLGGTVTALAEALSPVLVPGLLVGIYGANLFWKGYVFSQARSAEQLADKEHEDFIAGTSEPSKKLRTQISLLEAKLEQVRSQPTSASKTEASEEIVRQLEQLNKEYVTIEGQLEGRRSHFREARLEAEREMAFNAVEVACATLVTVGILLGASALIGASVASFGVVPFVLLIIGVVGAGLTKVFEKQDEKHHSAYTLGIRNALINGWNKIMHKGNEPSPQKTTNPAAVAPAQNQSSSLLIHSRLSQERSAAHTSGNAPDRLEAVEMNLRVGANTSFLDHPELDRSQTAPSAWSKLLPTSWFRVGNKAETQYRVAHREEDQRALENTLVDPYPPAANPGELGNLPKIKKGDILVATHSLSESNLAVAAANQETAKVGLIQECTKSGQELRSKLVLPPSPLSSSQLLQSVDFQIQEATRLMPTQIGVPPIVTLHSLELNEGFKPNKPLRAVDWVFLEYCLAMKLSCEVIQKGRPVTLSEQQLRRLVPGTDSEAIVREVRAQRSLTPQEESLQAKSSPTEEKEHPINLTPNSH